MKNFKKIPFRKCFLLIGIGLIIAAAILMFSWQREIHISIQQAAAVVDTLQTVLPEIQDTVLEERQDNTMPVLSIKGTDFVGILEMTAHGSALPVCADWGQPTRYPCCFNGSIYDGSMQIGAASQKGQFDFYREISVGDALFFTDMTGKRYAYEVTNILYEKHADQASLNKNDAALTLFIKNVYAFEYVIVFCDVAH